MNKVRIGNDIAVTWRITDSAGTAINLENRALSVSMQVGPKVIPVEDFDVDGNVIRFTFHGADQKYTGKYNLKLVDGNEQSEALTTYDTYGIFTLVGHSWQADDVLEGISVVTLNSQVVGYIGPKGDKGDKGDTGNTGAQGPAGPAAGFGTVSATVDNTTGTPTVQVTTSGPNTEKNITFSFTGLKGERGDTTVLDPTGFLTHLSYNPSTATWIFDGNFTVDGDLTVTGDVAVTGNLNAANIVSSGYITAGAVNPSVSQNNE